VGIFSSLKRAISPAAGRETPSWNPVVSRSEVDDIFRSDELRPQLVYKHSPACSVSWFVQAALDRQLDALAESADCHRVDVIGRGEISSYVASRSGVVHQSPQLILLHRGKVVWDASHGGIRPDVVRGVLGSLEVGGTVAGAR